MRNRLTWTSDEVRCSPLLVHQEQFTNDLPQNLSQVFRAVATGLDDTELPVRVHAALTLTEMVSSHDSVKAAVSPQVGKVIQGLLQMHQTR